MEDLDLTAAIEAAARHEWEYLRDDHHGSHIPPWGDATDQFRDIALQEARLYVEAAAPLIEAALREKLAQEIKAIMPKPKDAAASMDLHALRDGMERSERVVRGEG